MSDFDNDKNDRNEFMTESLISILERVYSLNPTERSKCSTYRALKTFLIDKGNWKNSPRGGLKGLKAINEKRKLAGVLQELKEIK